MGELLDKRQAMWDATDAAQKARALSRIADARLVQARIAERRTEAALQPIEEQFVGFPTRVWRSVISAVRDIRDTRALDRSYRDESEGERFYEILTTDWDEYGNE